MPELQRIHVNTGPGPICTALERDGACIVEEAVSAGFLAGLTRSPGRCVHS